ncbi:MAG TPA: hypothetical protein DE036_07180 [Actinobacteria bacterium]|nr:hypothetical protein [Actinomycetota bacterium]
MLFMDRAELERELDRLKEELEDIKLERYFMLEKTSIHVPGHLRNKYDKEIGKIENRIEKVETELSLLL